MAKRTASKEKGGSVGEAATAAGSVVPAAPAGTGVDEGAAAGPRRNRAGKPAPEGMPKAAPEPAPEAAAKAAPKAARKPAGGKAGRSRSAPKPAPRPAPKPAPTGTSTEEDSGADDGAAPALEPEVLAAEVVGAEPDALHEAGRSSGPRPRQELPIEVEASIAEEPGEGEASEEASEEASGEAPDETRRGERERPDVGTLEAQEALEALIEGERASRLPVPVGHDLAQADPLQRYLSEIARHPLLTREEEHELAAKFQSSRDPALAWRLVTANLRLVVKIAMEYRRAAFSVLDLIQEGNVGLMQAVQKYDPFRGVKLSSYAAWWIRAYILRYLMDNWRMVKLGTTQAQRKLFFNLRKEQEKLLAQGFDAAPKLLAERLDVSEQDVREMDQRLGNDEFSIDAPVAGGDEGSTGFVDRLVENRTGADDRLGEEELRRAFVTHLAAFGKTLTDERDLFLFRNRIAVTDGEEPMTLQRIGERYGFTRERARQLEARLLSQLRDYLKARLPDFAELSIDDPDARGSSRGRRGADDETP